MKRRDVGLIWATIVSAFVCMLPCGCAPSLSSGPLPYSGEIASTQNPALVPMVDQEFLWAQIHDELDNYFKVRREERVRVVKNTLTPGWIETFPVTGASVLEPWRRDASSAHERWLGTFQSIRRWARVTVVPQGNDLQIEVQVYKELEDLERPTETSAGGLTLRHDDSPEQEQDPSWYEPTKYGWIPLGRDAELERKILSNIVGRLSLP